MIGQEAHIIAKRPAGPRGDHRDAAFDLDDVENLILLCPTHHRLIDGDRDNFPVVALRAMKQAHEFGIARAVSESEDGASVRRDALLTTLYEWAARADIDRWGEAMSGLTWLPRPEIHRDDFDRLQRLRVWLRERSCLDDDNPLAAALANFLAVLDDLVPIFDNSVRFSEREILVTHLRYKDLDHWNPKMYDRLLGNDRRSVAAIRNLAFELTRAANYVCDVARRNVDPSFRLLAPAATLTPTSTHDLVVDTRRPEYRAEERTSRPYPGFKRLLKVGPRRDYWTREFDV